jgi:hypothetical protein
MRISGKQILEESRWLAHSRSFGSRRACQRLCRRACMVGVFRDLLQIRMHGLSECGEGDDRSALKESSAQFLLQGTDRVGQRGLGDPAATRCARETALFAQRQEIADLVHLHVFTLRRSDSEEQSALSEPEPSCVCGGEIQPKKLAGARTAAPCALPITHWPSIQPNATAVVKTATAITTSAIAARSIKA